MPTLRVVGLGVWHTKQITLQGLSHLQSAQIVLHLAGARDRLSGLSMPLVESLDSLYHDGERDFDNYGRIIETVLERLGQHDDVALLLPGHPRFGVTIVQRLEQLSQVTPFNLLISPGLSSFDTMLDDLKLDPLERGTLVVDANRLLLFDQVVNPEYNMFVYHVCSVGTSATHRIDPARDNRLSLLRDKLLDGFPPETQVTLVESAAAPDASAKLTHVQLTCMTELLPRITFNSTLFVPAVRPRRVDRDILALLRGAEAPT